MSRALPLALGVLLVTAAGACGQSGSAPPRAYTLVLTGGVGTTLSPLGNHGPARADAIGRCDLHEFSAWYHSGTLGADWFVEITLAPVPGTTTLGGSSPYHLYTSRWSELTDHYSLSLLATSGSAVVVRDSANHYLATVDAQMSGASAVTTLNGSFACTSTDGFAS